MIIMRGDSMKCELDVVNNPCEFFGHSTCECNNPNACSFQEQQPKEEPVPEPKKDKWFEKYVRAREIRYAREQYARQRRNTKNIR